MDRAKGFRSKHSPLHPSRPIDIEVSYERLVIYVSQSFRFVPLRRFPPFFFSSCTVPGRRTTTTYPRLRPKLSSRPLKALAKLLSNSRIRKSRLLEISFNRKPSSFPLEGRSMHASQFVKRELSFPHFTLARQLVLQNDVTFPRGAYQSLFLQLLTLKGEDIVAALENWNFDKCCGCKFPTFPSSRVILS